MPTILTRKFLNNWKCNNPDCTHDHSTLFFHTRCCVDEDDNPAPMQASYEKATGLLTLACVGCDEPLVVLQIADHAQTELH